MRVRQDCWGMEVLASSSDTSSSGGDPKDVTGVESVRRWLEA